jgi:hypothetical protein
MGERHRAVAALRCAETPPGAVPEIDTETAEALPSAILPDVLIGDIGTEDDGGDQQVPGAGPAGFLE